GPAARAAVAPLDADADEPIRAALRSAGVAWELLAAVYEPVGGTPVARLRIALDGSAEARAAARSALAAAGADPQAPRSAEEAIA
ncbi:hypothetical protein Q7L71_27395, partial [Conexibacter sp. CPCC 205706]